MSDHTVTNIQFRPAGPETKDNVVGWVACVLDSSIRLNNMVIKMNEEGKLELQYPQSQSKAGKKFCEYHPVNPSFHKFLETAIFKAISEQMKHFTNL